MEIQVSSFVTPRENSVYVGQFHLPDVAEAVDQNHNGQIDRDEVKMSGELVRKIDVNGDHTISNFEFVDALAQDQIRLRELTHQGANNVAAKLIPTRIYSGALGQIGRQLDTDRNGYVEREELSRALENGKLQINGNYLSEGQAMPNNSQSITEHIATIKSLIMKKNPYNGQYDNSTGIFTHQQANDKINDFIEKVLIPSERVSVADKLNLIKNQVMKKNAYNGQYDKTTGSLTATQAQELAKKALEQPSQLYNGSDAQDFVATIREQIMKKNAYNGQYNNSTGAFTHQQANDKINDFIEKVLIPSDRVSVADKLNLIKNQVMKKNAYNGQYDKTTGSLTATQAQELAKKVLEQPPQLYNSSDAQDFVATIREQIMKKNPYNGQYNNSTGAFTHQQANDKINDFIEKVVIPSDRVSVADKLNLIKNQVMKKNAYNGQYDKTTGSLTTDQARQLTEKIWQQLLDNRVFSDAA